MAVTPDKAIKIFYSYASEDEPLQKRLEKHLSNLRQQGLITDLHQGQILGGANRADTINSHLDAASIILLLVSPDFMTSEDCIGQMKRAMERQITSAAIVIPVLLRPTAYEGAPFENLQVLPKNTKPIMAWRNPEEGFLKVARGIQTRVEELASFSSKKKSVPPKVNPQVSNPGKYYVYLSDTKVHMLYSQIPKDIRQELAFELNIDDETPYSKVQFVTKYIEDFFKVGTIENPLTYFKGTLEMHWGPLTNDKKVVYFGGITERTVVGLGGSMHHIIGRNQGQPISTPSMSPLLFLEEALKVAAEDAYEKHPDQAIDPRVFVHPIDLVAHLTLNNLLGSSQKFEFLAKTLRQGPLTSQEHLPTGNLSHIVFGSPIYVALAD